MSKCKNRCHEWQEYRENQAKCKDCGEIAENPLQWLMDAESECYRLQKQVLQLTNSNKGLAIDSKLAWDEKIKAEQELAETNAIIEQMSFAFSKLIKNMIDYYSGTGKCGTKDMTFTDAILEADKELHTILKEKPNVNTR